MRNKETIGNDIVDELRKMTDAKACDITKDDFISVFAKAKPRTRFCLHFGAFIIEGREIQLGNDSKNIRFEYDDELDCKVMKCDEIRMNHVSLDGTYIDLDRLADNYHDDMSFEIVGI